MTILVFILLIAFVEPFRSIVSSILYLFKSFMGCLWRIVPAYTMCATTTGVQYNTRCGT